jgi:hypothetical protein
MKKIPNVYLNFIKYFKFVKFLYVIKEVAKTT